MSQKLTLRERFLKFKTGVRILICFEAIVIPLVIFSLIFPPSASNYIQQVMFIAVPILIWKFVERKPLYEMGFKRGMKSAKDFIVGLIFGAASISAVFAILLIFNNVSLVHSIGKPHFNMNALNGFVLCIMTGFAEETFFRGYCLKSICEKNSKLMAAVISSILFSALHSENPNVTPLFFINVALVGMLFSYMALKVNIWLPIGFHSMWNYFEGNVWGFPNSGIVTKGIYDTKLVSSNIINGGLVGPEGGLAATFIILIGLLAVYLIKGKKDLKL